jgi:hypothetical protein
MSDIPDCTLVTSCFCVFDQNPHSLSLEEIIKKTDTLLNIPCFLVIYGNKEVIPILREKRTENGFESMTIFIELELDELWTYSYREKVNNNRSIFWPTADVRAQIDSHLITCNKFDFVLKTIHQNPFKTSKFGWIDAYLNDNGNKICEEFQPEIVVDVLNNISDKFHIQVLNVTDKKFINKINKKEYYMSYRWVVCGCFFTCSRDIGIKILNRLKENFIETVESGFGHGEEMLYLEILEEFYDDIHKSYGDYGQILNNFNGSTRNLHYIYWFILKQYMKFKYYKEAYDCAEVLLKQIHSNKISYSYELFLNILMDYYMSAYFVNKTECNHISKYINNICLKDEAMMIEYSKHLDHYNFTLQLHE